MNPDWEAVRRAYDQGESLGSLSRRWSIPESTLRGRAQREGWKKIEGNHENAQKCCVQKGEPNLERMRRVDTLADAMLTCLERAVEELDTVTRTVKERVKREDGVDMTTDYTQTLAGEKGTVDRGGLKQLTGVLKDLKDVLMLRSDADSREQEMRIARLQRDLDQAQSQECIRVRLEGEVEGYAG